MDIYEEVLAECKVIIEQDFAPCNLDKKVKKRIKDLVEECKRRKITIAEKESRTTGNSRTIFSELFWALNFADSLSKNTGIDKCKYLKEWLDKPFGVEGGLGNYFLNHRE